MILFNNRISGMGVSSSFLNQMVEIDIGKLTESKTLGGKSSLFDLDRSLDKKIPKSEYFFPKIKCTSCT